MSVHFQGKLQYHRNPSLCPVTNAEQTQVEEFYDELQDLLELISKKDVLFIIGDWNAKVGSQEISGVTGKFGLEEQNKVGQRLTEFCLENAPVITNTLFQQHKRQLDIKCNRVLLSYQTEINDSTAKERSQLDWSHTKLENAVSMITSLN